jgi:hypothetical protein
MDSLFSYLAERTRSVMKPNEKANMSKSVEQKPCKCGHSDVFHKNKGRGRCVAWAWEKDENDNRGACECRQFEQNEEGA